MACEELIIGGMLSGLREAKEIGLGGRPPVRTDKESLKWISSEPGSPSPASRSGFIVLGWRLCSDNPSDKTKKKP